MWLLVVMGVLLVQIGHAADTAERLGGRLSLDVKTTPFSSYDARFIAQVQQRWYDLIDAGQFPARSGKVVVDFVLTHDGRINDVNVRESDVSDILSLLCKRALLDPAPFANWPDDMRRMIGSNKRDVTLTFYYGAVTASTAPLAWQNRQFREQLETQQKREIDEVAERRQKYVEVHTNLSERFRTNILNGHVLIGMATNDVNAAWGKPQRVNVTVSRFGVHENWIYGDTYLFFEDGKVTSWHQSRSP